MPSCDQRPTLGRNPAMPHSAAGTRTDPPVSVPMPAGANRAATASAVPPLDPPGIRRLSYGFDTAPNTGLLHVTPKASSCRVFLPSNRAPASNSWLATRASQIGVFRRNSDVPAVVGNARVRYYL